MVKYWDEKTKKIVNQASVSPSAPVEGEDVKVEGEDTTPSAPVEGEKPKKSRK